MGPHEGQQRPKRIGDAALPGVAPHAGAAGQTNSDAAMVSGSPSVAQALRELAGVAGRPLAEHPEAFGRVHAGLQQALSDIDDA